MLRALSYQPNHRNARSYLEATKGQLRQMDSAAVASPGGSCADILGLQTTRNAVMDRVEEVLSEAQRVGKVKGKKKKKQKEHRKRRSAEQRKRKSVWSRHKEERRRGKKRRKSESRACKELAGEGDGEEGAGGNDGEKL